MNYRTSSYAAKFLVIASIAVLVVALSGVPAHAQILGFTQGFNGNQLCAPPIPTSGCLITVTAGDGTINNSSIISQVPGVSGNVLQLTQNAPNQSGAAWFNTQQQIAGGFGVEFQFRILPNNNPDNSIGTADGFAFVIQNSSSGLAAIGGYGGGIGYGSHEIGDCSGLTTAAQYSVPPCTALTDLGIPNSVAIEFDTYQNYNYESDADHVAIQSCGTVDSSPDHNSPCLIVRSGFLGSLANPITLADGNLHYAQIVYLPYTATCPTNNACPNLSVYIDPGVGVNALPVVQAHVDLNNPCTAAGCPTGTILNGGAAWVGFTAATGGGQEEADIMNFTFIPSISKTLQGSGVTNSFVFPFATYNVTYPADVPITNTTMTITPTALPQADCNDRINIFGEGNAAPLCNTFSGAGGDAVIFDVACASGTNQTQGELCPTTSGFNPLQPNSTFHNNEDISNIVTSTDHIQAGLAPQFLTAPEGSSAWVPMGVGFETDRTKGGGTNNYNSQMVLADFPSTASNPSPFAIPPYQFNGFAAPVTNQGNNVLNIAQAGQTIPLKWQLMYPTCPAGSQSCFGFNGGPVTNSALAPAGYVTILAAIGCSFAPGTTPTNEIAVDNGSQTGLINDGNGSYHFNWKTLKSYSGSCRTATVNVGDGVPHNADFRFK
jgi:hypothetical protein